MLLPDPACATQTYLYHFLCQEAVFPSRLAAATCSLTTFYYPHEINPDILTPEMLYRGMKVARQLRWISIPYPAI